MPMLEEPRKPKMFSWEKWKEKQPNLDANKLVFLDESGVNLAMTRLYGWGEKCARVADYVPDVHGLSVHR